MNRIIVLGSEAHEQADNLEWTQPFCDIEKHDSLIIDLTSFPKDYPRTLFTNIGVLKRAARLFIRDNKEIFCIMEKPFNILFKEIPLNYAWIPFPQKLTVNPMLLGKIINSTNERFAEYLENVEKWDNELFWQDTDNCSFDSIAVNKVGNTIAATVTMINRGKIHFLPKTTKISSAKAIELLIKLATKTQKSEHTLLEEMETPENGDKGDLALENYHNLFSVDENKIATAVHTILEEFGITTKKAGISVQVISTKGMVETHDPKVNQIAKNIEEQRDKKVLVVANTYNKLPIKNRTNKEHVDLAMKLFFEINNTPFLTTLSLYNLWKKVITGQISAQEASTLIQTQNGEITI